MRELNAKRNRIRRFVKILEFAVIGRLIGLLLCDGCAKGGRWERSGVDYDVDITSVARVPSHVQVQELALAW